ncbi:MAG: Lpg1974 family pore-forming outer membrane protein [Simkaniaceae bacterium]|nr:Lpg1974 family pore-forming outer membrane protein [Candidatus Sacchlamyda saccharinae]
MHKSLIALSVLGTAGVAFAEENCKPEPPATCYTDDCRSCYCLGPDNTMVNAPVNPRTCDGDWIINVAGLYWNAQQDGMEYAIDNHVRTPDITDIATEFPQILQLNNLVDAEYKTPDFDWDWGFKADLGYNFTCDGWDIGIAWTWYRGKANDHIEAELDDNHTLLPLWSAFSNIYGSVLYASDIESHWKLNLNLIDIELGREYWTSKFLSFRPFVGLRVAHIDQNFEILHKGGSWSAQQTVGVSVQDAYNNEIDLENDFKGVGIRSGFDTTWNFGCGWGLYGNFAASVVYGRFSIDQDEDIRLATTPFDKIKVLEAKESFKASRAMLDFALGIQWSTMLCECQYGLTVQLGWEKHLFFHQNQLWRTNRIGDSADAVSLFAGLPNNSGENVFFQRRGTLDTQGFTLSVQFEF